MRKYAVSEKLDVVEPEESEKVGWAARELKRVAAEAKQWPDWMKRAARPNN